MVRPDLFCRNRPLTPLPTQVESALAEREHLNGGSDGMAVREVGGGLGEEGEARLEEMQQEIDVSRVEYDSAHLLVVREKVSEVCQ